MKPRARIKVIKAAPRSSRKRDESTLLARIRLAVGSRPDFLVTRINTGVYAAPGHPEQRVRSAPNGFPDLIGTQLRRVLEHVVVGGEQAMMRYEKDEWRVYGQAIAVETKSTRGELSDAQIAWRDAFERVGGVYVLARSVDDVYAVLGYQAEEWTR